MDLKRRVALDHLDWVLSGYRGAEFDYWAEEATEEAPVSTLSAVAQEEIGGTKDTLADDPAA